MKNKHVAESITTKVPRTGGEPFYPHDCTQCVFLGRYDGYDVYVCPQHGSPTIVARYGDDGHEYKSGGTIHSHDEVLSWGLGEAFARGFLKLDTTVALENAIYVQNEERKEKKG